MMALKKLPVSLATYYNLRIIVLLHIMRLTANGFHKAGLFLIASPPVWNVIQRLLEASLPVLASCSDGFCTQTVHYVYVKPYIDSNEEDTKKINFHVFYNMLYRIQRQQIQIHIHTL